MRGRIMRVKAKIENANIRGCEKRQNKKGEDYLLVRFEDETGAPCEMVDKEIDRQQYYKRNTDMDLYIDIDMGRFTTIRIIDAKILETK